MDSSFLVGETDSVAWLQWQQQWQVSQGAGDSESEEDEIEEEVVGEDESTGPAEVLTGPLNAVPEDNSLIVLSSFKNCVVIRP